MGMDVIGIKNKEVHFGANVWTWRPVHVMIDYVNEKYSLDIDTTGFGFNDGKGVPSKEKCMILASVIRKELDSPEFKSASDSLYLAIGQKWKRYPSDIPLTEKEYKESNLEEYSGYLLNGPVVKPNGDQLVPAYSISKERLYSFCEFLDVCGGFQIY